MSCCGYCISEHALKRTIERFVLSQNIKLNKKQKNKNKGKALKTIQEDINNLFAVSYSRDHKFKYMYSKINKFGKCRKYVLFIVDKTIVTVIDNIDIEKEMKIKNIIFVNKTVNIADIDNQDDENIIDTNINNFSSYMYLLIKDI